MLPILFFVLLTAPMVLGVEEGTTVHSTATATVMAGLGEPSKLHKAHVYNMTLSARKPKRSNGEIPLLIIRPIEKKKKKQYKDHMVKIMSGGVASYGNYPEIHTSEHEVFSLEHMLPILGLEGMVFNGPKYPKFVPSPQYKPSDFHYIHQKFKEETPVMFSYKPTEAEPAQSFPSPPPPDYEPAVNTEDQLLKLGHEALSKLETPVASVQPPYSSLGQEKPIFLKSEQLPGKFNFQHGQSYKSVPIGGGHPGFRPGTFVGMHNEIIKYHKPHFYPSKPSSYKWPEQQKKPQMVSPLSISTNFYYPKTLVGNAEDGHQQQQHMTYYQHQEQPTAPQVQTHVSYYIPQEIETLPHPQPEVQQHTAPEQIHQPSLPVNTVQNGEHVDFIVPKQPSHEEPPKTYYKQKFYKQQHGGQQANYYIHKQFEYSGKPNGDENNIAPEYHGSHSQANVESQQLPEPQPYAAPQYLPLQQVQQQAQQQQQQQQPSPALTLHQTHPQPQPFHHPSSTSAHQNHWKLGRRNHHEHVKPVVESGIDPEQDNSHEPSVHSIKTLKPAEKSTTEVKVEIEHIAQSRVGDKQRKQQQQQQQQKSISVSESTTVRPTTTRAGRQGW